MSYKKFKEKDVILNTMRTHPKSEFFIFDARVYYNNTPTKRGKFNGHTILSVGRHNEEYTGFISLFEYNIDRNGVQNPFIFPYINKNTSRTSFKTAGDASAPNEWSGADVGAILTSNYPLSASITREWIPDPIEKVAGPQCKKVDPDIEGSPHEACAIKRRHFYALKNKLTYNSIRSYHYSLSSSITPNDATSNGCRGRGGLGAHDCNGFNKEGQKLNLISIPSIFYGKTIKPGSVSLKWYYTGSLLGELRDTKRNGELIQVSGAFSSSQGGMLGGNHIGAVAGTILYDEGFILLTGSWNLAQSDTIGLLPAAARAYPQWIYWGAGANETGPAADVVNKSTAHSSLTDAAFTLNFEGTTDTQVMTMFARTAKGESNYSNNPTYQHFGQDLTRVTSSFLYEENPNRTIFNTVSSSYTGHSASFERQVYISKVALYDNSKNLVGIASLATPVLKKETQDITFKIKLDM